MIVEILISMKTENCELQPIPVMNLNLNISEAKNKLFGVV